MSRVLAVNAVADMFGDGRMADNPKDAGALSGSIRKNPAPLQPRVYPAKGTVGNHFGVDAAQLATVSAARLFVGGGATMNGDRAAMGPFRPGRCRESLQ